ncbi:DUF4920 domain-containing protein [Pontibacter cellulosilyticus]|uniref:DUF4920 domain-containing protein n=1 Tax=Pontibacter cellulosilyticus TaxID=1720253 RepID=A0A923SLQ0_9BACT|nr:DUF4920 domain-containing protein [Pontibacter cellulosilyticus]MBC5991375.1 DUF4920 domain-containing protein [Pontibacter cellulosilyticus]
MKKTIFGAFAIVALVACNQTKPTETTEPTASTASAETGNTYGASFAAENVVSPAELQTQVQGKDSVEAVVSTEIVESCQSKGCWMDVKLADNSTMKVTFRDYGFFLPVEDLKGRTVIFKGTAKREVISVDDQRHYAQDAGKSKEEIAAITQPKEELRFVADGVILK